MVTFRWYLRLFHSSNCFLQYHFVVKVPLLSPSSTLAYLRACYGHFDLPNLISLFKLVWSTNLLVLMIIGTTVCPLIALYRLVKVDFRSTNQISFNTIILKSLSIINKTEEFLKIEVWGCLVMVFWCKPYLILNWFWKWLFRQILFYVLNWQHCFPNRTLFSKNWFNSIVLNLHYYDHILKNKYKFSIYQNIYFFLY